MYVIKYCDKLMWKQNYVTLKSNQITSKDKHMGLRKKYK